MKRIGILAHSGEGAALCFLAAVHEGERKRGAHFHPHIVMDIEAMGASMADWESLDLAPVRARFANSVHRLAAAGADFFICPDNTAHLALEAPGADFALPGLHIAGVVADEAKRRGFSKIAVTGTRWTMEGPIYPREFAKRGLQSLAPEEDEREIIQAIIFDELVRGSIRDGSRNRFAAVVSTMKDQGCDAVVLGCTELPMLLDDSTSPLPTLDSTRLLARAAVEVAVSEKPLPSWRGGSLLR
ncbi:MAG: amino acid racemase [Proteobacteria bacterium]|nr:amino acid racemase [Pseudomonadota bacterium]